MITTEFLADLEKFTLIVRKKITSKYSGSRASSEPGRGLTLKEYRQYTPGDDIRAIDWKVYARTDDLFIKVFEEDKDLSVHLILDSSLSMDYGSSITKFDYASMIAAGFLFLAMHNNERFRYSFIGNGLEVHPMRRGRAHFANFVNSVNNMKPSGKMSLYDALQAYKLLLKSKSMVIIVSDFLYDAADIERAIGSIAKHDVKLIRVLDKDEVELPFEGDYKFMDPESEGNLRTYVTTGSRASYLSKLEKHNNAIMSMCNSLGFDFDLVNTSQKVFDAFYSFLKK